MKITFTAEGIKEVKTTNFKKNLTIDEIAERFRQDMLAKHGLLFKGVPHAIGIIY